MTRYRRELGHSTGRRSIWCISAQENLYLAAGNFEKGGGGAGGI